MEQIADKFVVIYHANCVDGIAAAAMADYGLREKHGDSTKIVCIPQAHGKPHLFTYEHCSIYVVDFMFPLETLREMAGESNYITVLDHHKTTQEMFTTPGAEAYWVYQGVVRYRVADSVEVLFSNDICGAMLTWHFFHSSHAPCYTDVPRVLKYVDDYDRWVWKYGARTDYIHEALALDMMTIEAWRDDTYLLDDEDVDQLVDRGRPLVDLRNKLIAQYVTRAYCVPLLLPDNTMRMVPFVNAPRWLSSHLGHELAKDPAVPCAAVWEFDGERYVISLRSAEPHAVDVSAIAKRNGGGGHKHAAGFSVTQRDWYRWFM